MIVGLESILIGSENAQDLGKFYKDVLDLKMGEEWEFGEDNEYGVSFELHHGITLNIMSHSKVKGTATHPERIMFNLEVDDIEKEVERLKKEKVKVVQDMYHIEDYGYVATFADPDGNYFQLVKTRE
jgi:predicted enzyme related to lactoylglutathione lyase